jgi:hypothetical protein
MTLTCAYRNPGVLGLETLTTKTSENGPKARTPKTKSSIDSAEEALFLPKFTASSDPGRSEALDLSSTTRNDGIRDLIRERTDACPWDGKP